MIYIFSWPQETLLKSVEMKGSINYFSSLIKWILVDQAVCYKVQWFSVFTKNNIFFFKKKKKTIAIMLLLYTERAGMSTVYII